MIEINLLPGQTAKKGGRAGAGMDVGAAASLIVSKVKDPWLIGAVGSLAFAGLAIGGLYWYQRGQVAAVDQRLQVAKTTNDRYTGVIKEKRRAEAERDSVVRQVDLIKSFDNKRFVWPHIMDEISRALPPYTWLTSVVQTNMGAPAASAAAPTQKPGDKAPRPPEVDSSAVPRVRLKIIGNTVDIQALTRFMKLLEASPFLENVQLDKSSIILIDGKEVTEFTLTAFYQT
ncbi:MAG TPA: PilN domain-containing protein, partial [Gemmatimonadaceae bacterium]|nr:PilN domain-containing protein [Gemmatimonadaceae bacterium]